MVDFGDDLTPTVVSYLYRLPCELPDYRSGGLQGILDTPKIVSLR